MTSAPDDPSIAALRVQAAAQAILSYLRLHPDSADSWRGVQLWLRLLPEELSEHDVREALKGLVQRGEIRAWRVPGGDVIYGRAAPNGPA